MGFSRTIRLIFSLVFIAPSLAAAASLPIWIDDQIYTLELREHIPAGLDNVDGSTHYKGHISGIEDSWTRTSLIGNQWEGVVSLRGELHLIDVQTNAAKTRSLQSTVTKATPASEYQEIGTCGLHEKSDDGIDAVSPRAMTLSAPTAETASFNTLCASTVDGVCLLAEIDFVFDEKFQSIFPTDYRSRATQLINIMEGYYRNDLDIAFKTLSTTFLTSTVFSTTTDSFDLLDDMSAKKRDGALSFSSKDESLLQLITGRDFDGSTAGVAWLKGLCDGSGYFSTSTAQVIGGNISVTALVAAHEVGHNLGSRHDGDGNTCGAGFIMAASLSPSASQFSSCSVDMIQSAISDTTNQNACFDYPFDVDITGNNGDSSLITSSVTRSFIINASDASVNINEARVAGNITSGPGNFTSVTIDSSDCTIAADSQSYSCTISNPGSNHSLTAEMSVATGSYTVGHNVSVSQSQLTETDTTNNSVSDSFTVLLGGGNDSGDNEDQGTGTEEPAPDMEEDASEPAASKSESSGPGSSGGGSMNPVLMMCLSLVLLITRRKVKFKPC